MGRVALETVEKAGVDVNKLLDLLVRSASAELTTYYYTILTYRFHRAGWRSVKGDCRRRAHRTPQAFRSAVLANLRIGRRSSAKYE
jgi:hypothetical protein